MAIILASKSPRRKELLQRMGIEDFIVRPAKGEETVDPDLSPAELVAALSGQKCWEIAHGSSRAYDIVIAADTIVCVDGEILGKPATEEEAAEMLKKLSGRMHTVYSGVSVSQGRREMTECEETNVYFRTITEEEIALYIATGEPMDKAGGYGIQGYGCLFVERIEGDYFNVMGLPVCRLGRILKEFGIDALASAAEKGTAE